MEEDEDDLMEAGDSSDDGDASDDDIAKAKKIMVSNIL